MKVRLKPDTTYYMEMETALETRTTRCDKPTGVAQGAGNFGVAS
jgi:hypothetical protein